MDKTSVIASALALPAEDRLEVAELLWESVPDGPLSDEQAAELDRRVAEHERNPKDLIPWEQVRREFLGE